MKMLPKIGVAALSCLFLLRVALAARTIANTVHWDGAKESTGPCLLMLVGEGPMHTTPSP